MLKFWFNRCKWCWRFTGLVNLSKPKEFQISRLKRLRNYLKCVSGKYLSWYDLPRKY